MKHTKISILALAVLLNSGLALAQHGHGASGNMGAADHKSMKGGSNNASRHETVSDLLSKNSKLSNKLQTLTGLFLSRGHGFQVDEPGEVHSGTAPQCEPETRGQEGGKAGGRRHQELG
jgi:hypothetical protein